PPDVTLPAPARASCARDASSRLPAGVTVPTRDCRLTRPLARETDDMETTRRARRVSWPVLVVVAAALVYSWIASGFRAFTHAEAIAVSIPLIVAGIALLRARSRFDEEAEAREELPRRGTWVWVSLVVVLLVWELVSFRLSPRIDHPTLSSIADAVMS